MACDVSPVAIFFFFGVLEVSKNWIKCSSWSNGNNFCQWLAPVKKVPDKKRIPQHQIKRYLSLLSIQFLHKQLCHWRVWWNWFVVPYPIWFLENLRYKLDTKRGGIKEKYCPMFENVKSSRKLEWIFLTLYFRCSPHRSDVLLPHYLCHCSPHTCP